LSSEEANHGGLAHLLRNRFYIGEVIYRGETFRGDHAAR
jgi:hypothetical protein